MKFNADTSNQQATIGLDFDDLSPRNQEAIRVAKLGWRVLPLVAGAKEPVDELNEQGKGGFYLATNDIYKIMNWIEKYPDCNWGIYLGNDAVGIDIDRLADGKNPYPDDPEKAASFMDSASAMAITPSGGTHVYFGTVDGKGYSSSGYKEGKESRAGLAPNVDVCGHSRYLVLHGSVINGVAYAWLEAFELNEPPGKLKPPPSWLLQRLAEVDAGKGKGGNSEKVAPPSCKEVLDNGFITWVNTSQEWQDRAFDALIEVGWKPAGNCRLTRPGKASGVSASWNYCRNSTYGYPYLFVYSSSTDYFTSFHKYSPFEVLKAVSEDFEVLEKEMKEAYGDALKLIFDEEPTVPCDSMEPFPLVEVFPLQIAEFIELAAKELGVDPAFLAVPAIAICAAAVGAKRLIQIDPNWDESACLWCVVSADSGTKKTPSLACMDRQLQEFDMMLREESARKASLAETVGPKEPVERLVFEDVTVEAAQEAMRVSPRGIILLESELDAFFNSLRDSNGRDNSTRWNKFYERQPIRVDRVGRGCSVVKRPNLCVAGMAQPDILAKHFTAERFANGSAARFVVAAPPCPHVDYSGPPVGIEQARRDYDRYIRAVLELDGLEERLPLSKKPEPLSGGGELSAYQAWLEDHNDRGRRKDRKEGRIRAQLAKASAWAARWALVHAVFTDVIGGGTGRCEVGLQSMLAGIKFAQWAERETIRATGMPGKIGNDPVAEKVLTMLHAFSENGLAPRDLVQKVREFRGNSAKAKEVLDRLCDGPMPQARKVEVRRPGAKTATRYFPL